MFAWDVRCGASTPIPSRWPSLSLYQSQCPHIALINSQLQNNFTNLEPLKLQSKWFKCYLETCGNRIDHFTFCHGYNILNNQGKRKGKTGTICGGGYKKNIFFILADSGVVRC